MPEDKGRVDSYRLYEAVCGVDGCLWAEQGLEHTEEWAWDALEEHHLEHTEEWTWDALEEHHLEHTEEEA